MNSALLILAQDSRVAAMRAKSGSADISQGFEVADIFRFRVEISGISHQLPLPSQL